MGRSQRDDDHRAGAGEATGPGTERCAQKTEAVARSYTLPPPPLERRRAALIPETTSYRRLLLALCVVWVLLNFNVLFMGRVLPWDAIDQFYPTVYFNAHALRSGQWPWWNPYIYGGYAQIGDPQGMMFSPLLMAWMVLRAEPGAVWFCWGVLLHLLLGGAAMLDLLRRHGANALGCLVGATVFMAGGVAASRLEHTPIVIAYAYVPVVLLALRYLLSRPSIGFGCLLGFAAGAMVTQLVQVTYLFVLMIAAYGAVAVVRQWSAVTVAQRRALAMAMAMALVVALVVGLPQLAFSWAAMSLSNRNALPLSFATVGSLDLRTFAFLVHPNAFNAQRDLAHSPVDVIEGFLYIGVVPLLALFGLKRAWSDGATRRTLVFFGAVAVAASLYMLGTHTPLYGWLYAWLPGLVHFRRPADAAYLLNFALAFVSGIAASRIDLQSRRELTVLLVVATAWLAVLAASMHHGSSFVCVAVAAFALWRLRKPGSDWRAAVWLVAVLVADYRSFNLNGTFNEGGDGAARFARHPAVRYLSEQLSSGQVGMADRITTTNTNTNWDNTVIVTGMSSTQGYNPLRYALYETWYGPRESSSVPAVGVPYNVSPTNRLDDLLGVRYVVVGHRTDLPPYTPPPQHHMVQAGRDVDIWRRETAYPRFLNPTLSRSLAVDEWPAASDFEATDFATTLWLTPRDNDDFVVGRATSLSCGGIVDARVRASTHTRIDLLTRSTEAGWIVAGELDYPGWEAELDGIPLAVHRANGMFRAVCVPAGDHSLSFVFHPWHLVAYAWRRQFGTPGTPGS